MTNLKSQSGRSMVEMLGVLAIIGVLSIGGIAGYTMAMNRYKANEVLNAASTLSVIAQSQINSTTVPTLDKVGYSSETVNGCEIKATAAGKGAVTIKCDDAGVITAIENISGVKLTKDTATNAIDNDGKWVKGSTTTQPEDE